MYELKKISMVRLHPLRMRRFIWGMLFISLLTNGLTMIGIYNDFFQASIQWYSVADILLTLFAIQGLGTLLFHSERTIYRHQRFQSICFCLVSLKIPIDLYLFYFFMAGASDFPTVKHLPGLILLFGGILLTILLTIYGLRRASNGNFREGGKLLYNFQQSKAAAWISLVIAVLIVLLSLGQRWIGYYYPGWGEIFFLFLCVSLHYGVAMAWPEFVLLAFCKFRFKEFILEKEEQGSSLWDWFWRPIAVLKSFTGWKSQEKAPKWTILLVLGQFGVLFFGLLRLLEDSPMDYTFEGIIVYLAATALFAIPTCCLIILIFWLIRVIFKK